MSAPRNAEYTKLYNQKTFLRLLRRAPLSRADIAREMGLSRAAASLIAEELIRDGLVTEAPPQFFIIINRISDIYIFILF